MDCTFYNERRTQGTVIMNTHNKQKARRLEERFEIFMTQQWHQTKDCFISQRAHFFRSCIFYFFIKQNNWNLWKKPQWPFSLVSCWILHSSKKSIPRRENKKERKQIKLIWDIWCYINDSAKTERCCVTFFSLKMTQHESIKVKVEHFPGGFSRSLISDPYRLQKSTRTDKLHQIRNQNILITTWIWNERIEISLLLFNCYEYWRRNWTCFPTPKKTQQRN